MEYDDYEFDLNQAIKEEEQIFLEDPLLDTYLIRGYDDDEMELVEESNGGTGVKSNSNDLSDKWTSGNLHTEAQLNLSNKTASDNPHLEDYSSQSL